MHTIHIHHAADASCAPTVLQEDPPKQPAECWPQAAGTQAISADREAFRIIFQAVRIFAYRNWGFLYNRETDAIKLAPLWDQGSSLYPQTDEVRMQAVMQDEDELLQKIYVFPDSAIRHNGKKDFLLRTSFIGCISIVHSRFADSPSPVPAKPGKLRRRRFVFPEPVKGHSLQQSACAADK